MGGWDGVDPTTPPTNAELITDISTSCEPIKTNADLANMDITKYFWSSDATYNIQYCNPNTVSAGTWGTNPATGAGYDTQDECLLLDPEQVATPCGLIAKSVFTDKFTLYRTQDDTTKALSD